MILKQNMRKLENTFLLPKTVKFFFAHNGFKVKRSCVIYSFQTIKIKFQPQKLKNIEHWRPLLLVGRARQKKQPNLATVTPKERLIYWWNME